MKLSTAVSLATSGRVQALRSMLALATEGCGGLPEPEALCAQLREAGLQGVASRNVGAPLERFYAFVGRRG